MSENMYTNYGHAAAAIYFGYEIAHLLTDEEKAELQRQAARRTLIKQLEDFNWDQRFYDVLRPELKAMLSPEEILKIRSTRD